MSGDDTKDDWKILLVSEGCKTLRCLFGVAGLSSTAWAIAWAVRGVYGSEPTIWTVALALIAAITANSPPVALVTIIMRKRFQAYIAAHHRHTINLEGAADTDRTTSGLREDGTHPHDL